MGVSLAGVGQEWDIVVDGDDEHGRRETLRHNLRLFSRDIRVIARQY